MIRSIARTDLKRLFRSPLSWTLLAVVTFLLAFLFLAFVENFITQILPENIGAEKPLGTTATIITPLFSWSGIILLGILPLITMRSLSSEYEKNTWQLLATSTAKPWQIILGKYFANLVFLSIAISIILLMQMTLYFGSKIDSGVLFSSMLGLWLMLAATAAAGTYFSALSTETGTAALLTFGLLLFLYVLQVTANMPGRTSPLFYYLSPWTHYSAFLKARFSSLHLLYFLLFISLFLWLSIRQIEKKLGMHQHKKPLALLQLVIGIACIIGCAWLSIRFTLHADLSQQKHNSLPNEAITVLERMDLPLKITAVVENRPDIHRRIQSALAPFLQQKKDIELIFADSKLQRLQNQGSLQEEGQLIFEYDGRQVTSDNLDQKLIINSLSRLSQRKQAWLIFLEGHGELNLLETGKQGLSRLAKQLHSQGYKTYSHSLVRNPTIPDNTDLLIIAGVSQDYLPAEVSLISDYLTKGGSLLWLHDNHELRGLEELLDILPLEFLPGMIVNADESVQKLIGSDHPAVFPVIDYNNHPLAEKLDGQVILAFARALEPTGQPPWQVKSFLQTPQACWNETDSLQGHIKPDKDSEQGGPFSAGLSLSRQVTDREQRVIIIGDKDFMSNELIGYARNNELSMRIFNWLIQDQSGLQLPRQTMPDADLELSTLQLNLIAITFLLAMPLAFLLIGLRQWRYYRNNA